MLTKLINKSILKRSAVQSRWYSQIMDPQKKEWLGKILVDYKLEDQLAPLQDSVVTDTDYQIMRIPPTANVRQIYVAYINNVKVLSTQNIENKEVRTKLIEQTYHKLVIAKIKDFDNLSNAEQTDLHELLKQKMKLMSNVNLSTTQQLLQMHELKSEKVWKEPRYYPLFLVACWLAMGISSFSLEP